MSTIDFRLPLPPTVGSRHTTAREDRDLPPMIREQDLKDYKSNQGSKQRIRASAEQLERRARAWFGIKFRPLNSLLSLYFPYLCHQLEFIVRVLETEKGRTP
ncbi:hypothetical protein M9H77_30609 [Catharanthus roseus]|uniref:Uncharacterized protein n=1 Tax=Catharanthus roseus TaxID=4058 RepID=A0ACB9ZZ19_CATRO|nr:hypothetical protein M9H77_30609 [Catharanthus roseus]